MKEYNDRWNKPLVNPGFTLDNNGKPQPIDGAKPKTVTKTPAQAPKQRDINQEFEDFLETQGA